MPKRLPKFPGAKRLRRHLHSRAAHSCGRSTAGARAHPVGKRTMVGCLRVREATRDTRAVPAGQCHPELCTNKATETRARKDGPDMRAGRKRGADRAIGSRRRQQRLVACRQRVQPVACHQAVQAVTPAAPAVTGSSFFAVRARVKRFCAPHRFAEAGGGVGKEGVDGAAAYVLSDGRVTHGVWLPCQACAGLVRGGITPPPPRNRSQWQPLRETRGKQQRHGRMRQALMTGVRCAPLGNAARGQRNVFAAQPRCWQLGGTDHRPSSPLTS